MLDTRPRKQWTAKSLAEHDARCLGLAAAHFIRRTPAYEMMRQRQAAGGDPVIRYVGANSRIYAFVEMGKGWP